MFKYVEFEEVVDKLTTHGFRAKNDSVKVNSFDVNVVSLEGKESDIDELIANQNKDINCKELTKDEFKNLVSDSAQLNRIRSVVKERIASKYSAADEIAMMKRDEANPKRVAYEKFVQESIQIGNDLKSLIGY